MKTMNNRGALRRTVLAAGGFYSRPFKSWMFPGISANTVPWPVKTEWFKTLEEAAERAEGYAAAVAQLKDFERGESRGK